MKKLRVLDLFSGIGGFSLGLERTGGFETVAFCEIDEPAGRVLSNHWPDVPVHKDVTTYDFKEGEADVITAGFPCQDLSYAGAGAGLSGARSGLYRYVIRAIRVVRPRRAVLENVAALLSRGLGTVLGDLAAVGYDAEWHCIPASAVGAPHRRDRIWIVANPGGEQHEGDSAPICGEIATELARINTNAPGERCAQERELRHEQPEEWPPGFCEEMADPERFGQQGQGQSFITGYPAPPSEGKAGHVVHGGFRNQWAAEPNVGRVAHGVPARVDRLRCLGNSVVPQIPELIGRAILQSMERAA